jgi:methionine salvage enolase-phosphatase E1
MMNLTKAKIKRDEMVEEDNENKKLLLEIEAHQLDNYAKETLILIEGAFKEMETLAQLHDQLKEKLGDVTEEEFEKAQVKSHIKRAVNQAVREVKEGGKIKAGNAEYLEQSGLSTTAVLKDIFDFLEEESQAGIGGNKMLHKFLDDTAEKYGKFYIEQAEWLGFDPHADRNLTYEQ